MYSVLVLVVGLLSDTLCLLYSSSLVTFWHGSRTLYRDVFAGVDPELEEEQVEWGFYQKVGDKSTRTKQEA